MFHKKALLPALCVSLCLCGGIVVPASAVNVPTVSVSVEGIIPYARYIQDTRCTLEITGKTAKVYSMVNGQIGLVDRCRVVVYLQEKSGSAWKNIATWSDESNSGRASVSETKKVTAGKTYRAKAVVTAWSGGASETETILSSEEKA